MVFFSGSWSLKLDEKGRFVLPQNLRYGLVEEGKCEFTIGLGLGGCLTIYKKSVIEKIAENFAKKQHIAKYQPFFTTFFSTLHPTTCDKLGRTTLPPLLRQSVGIQKEIVVAGVLNKIEIWSKTVYEENLKKMTEAENTGFTGLMEEAFALLDEEKNEVGEKKKLSVEDLEMVSSTKV